MARAPRSRKPANVKHRSRQGRFPARYSHDYPVNQGHHYSLNAIPLDIWARAKTRAHAEERSVRVVLIRALDLYGRGKLDL